MTDDFRSWALLLERLGSAVRAQVAAAVRSGQDLRAPVAQEGGDTVFAIDRHVEPVIEREIETWPAEYKPLLLIAEGFGDDGRRVFGPADQPLRYRLLIDPIDGTRSL